MPALRARVNSLLANKADPSNVSGAINELRSGGGAKSFSELAAQVDRLSDRMARVGRGFQQSLDYLYRTLRNTEQSLEGFTIEDADGRLLGQAGEWTDADGQLHRGGHFVELYVGDSVGNRDAADAPLYATEDGEVIIGKGGRVNVRDQYDGMAAWIGASFDTLAVTGAADNGAGLIRLTVTAHTLATGDGVLVDEVGGVPNSRGEWTVTSIDADHVDLQGSVFDGTYTSGGTITRLLHITGAADNGSGLFRLNVTAHGYESGDRVSVLGAGDADGQWTIAVIDADHFDLEGSTFAGLYAGGGTCVRYFGGGLFQTFAIGDSFGNYKLRAFANGDLRIKDALISLTGVSGGNISLDPEVPEIRITGVGAQLVVDGTQDAVRVSGGEPGGDAGITIFDRNTPERAFFLDRRGAKIVGEMIGGPTFELLTNYAARVSDWMNWSSLVLQRNTWHTGMPAAVSDGTCEIDVGSAPHISIDDYTDPVSGLVRSYVAAGDINARRYVDFTTELRQGGTTRINSTGKGFLSELALTTALPLASGGTAGTTAAGARTSLSVYSKAEVDALLALKADHGTFAVSGGGGGSVTI